MKLKASCCLALLTVILTAWNGLRGQAVSTSQVSGVVRDTSGAAIPGANVRLTQTDTAASRTAVTSSFGTYVIPNLPVGPYRLEVTKGGFAAYVQTGIVLQVGVNPSINVTLKVGAVTQQVVVQAASPMVETENTGVGQVVDQEQVLDLPLNGRQATQLIVLAGAATPAPAGDLNTNKNYPTVTLSVAGGLPNHMTYLLDGGIHNDPFNSLNLPIPFPDALQEFKVETNSLPARYGLHASAAVNAVTKSGGNRFHGDLFEFVRNYMFNARNFFATSRDSLKRNQFGGVIGGPIARNKLFFFGGYQGTITKSNPPQTIGFVPTQAMLKGDFSAYASAACQGHQVTLAAPFANNQVDPSLFSPQALSLLKYVPSTSDPCGKVVYGIVNNTTDNQGIARIDWQINPKQAFFGRYFIARYLNPSTWDGKNVLQANKTGQLNRDQSLDLGYTYVISQNAINSLHVVGDRTLGQRTMVQYFSPCDLGVNMACYAQIGKFMGLSIDGGFSVGGGATNPGYFNSTSYQLADDFNFIHGAHELSFGVDYIRNIMNTLNNRPTNGQFTFSSGAPGRGSTYGLGYADFLLGSVDSFLQGNPVFDNDKSNYIGLYAQDSWRVTPGITFNYGLRWEPFLPETNTNGFVEQFNMGNFSNGVTSSVYKHAPAGLSFPGDPGYPGRADSFGKLNDFEPRLGLVWDPTGSGRIVLRSGYGIFYDVPQLFFYTRMSNNPPWGAQISLNDVPFSNPYLGYPGGNPFPALNKVSKDMTFPTEGVYNVFPLHMRPTYIQAWNVSLEEQVGAWLFSEIYLGNKTTHLWLGRELDPAVYMPGATTRTTNQRRVLYLQNPAVGQYYATLGQVDDGGNQNYNGMILSAQRRMAGHLSLLANWTWSHCLSDAGTTEMTGPTYPNPANRDYADCDSDRRHVVNVSLIATTPSRFSDRALQWTAANWQFSTILEGSTGDHSTVVLGSDAALSGIGSQRPTQVLADIYPANKSYGNYLSRAAFGTPAPGTYSPMGAFTVLDPGIIGLDFALQRNFRIQEGKSIQFRWEVFNAPNRVNFIVNGGFGASTTSLSSGLFGKITNASDPRIMQFALKYVF